MTGTVDLEKKEKKIRPVIDFSVQLFALGSHVPHADIVTIDISLLSHLLSLIIPTSVQTRMQCVDCVKKLCVAQQR